MALVGSLVFFLIEVLYVGEYQARLNYAFALFVFAAVLIAPHLDRNGLGTGVAVCVAARALRCFFSWFDSSSIRARSAT